MHKQWIDAERRYGEIVERYSDSNFAPEALYWKGVSRYKATNDHAVLGPLAEQFKQKYRDSVWSP